MTISQDITNIAPITEKPTSSALTNSRNHDIISISEYRKILNDNKSSDEEVRKKVTYLEAFCRNIVRQDVEKFVRTKINEQSKKNIR